MVAARAEWPDTFVMGGEWPSVSDSGSHSADAMPKGCNLEWRVIQSSLGGSTNVIARSNLFNVDCEDDSVGTVAELANFGATMTVTGDKSVISGRTNLTFTWDGATGYRNDYIAVRPAGAPVSDWLAIVELGQPLGTYSGSVDYADMSLTTSVYGELPPGNYRAAYHLQGSGLPVAEANFQIEVPDTDVDMWLEVEDGEGGGGANDQWSDDGWSELGTLGKVSPGQAVRVCWNWDADSPSSDNWSGIRPAGTNPLTISSYAAKWIPPGPESGEIYIRNWTFNDGTYGGGGMTSDSTNAKGCAAYDDTRSLGDMVAHGMRNAMFIPYANSYAFNVDFYPASTVHPSSAVAAYGYHDIDGDGTVSEGENDAGLAAAMTGANADKFTVSSSYSEDAFLFAGRSLTVSVDGGTRAFEEGDWLAVFAVNHRSATDFSVCDPADGASDCVFVPFATGDNVASWMYMHEANQWSTDSEGDLDYTSLVNAIGETEWEIELTEPLASGYYRVALMTDNSWTEVMTSDTFQVIRDLQNPPAVFSRPTCVERTSDWSGSVEIGYRGVSSARNGAYVGLWDKDASLYDFPYTWLYTPANSLEDDGFLCTGGSYVAPAGGTDPSGCGGIPLATGDYEVRIMNPNRRMGGWSDLRIATPGTCEDPSVSVSAPFYIAGDEGRIEWNGFEDNMDYNVGFAKVCDPTDADYASCLISAKAGTLADADVAERHPVNGNPDDTPVAWSAWDWYLEDPKLGDQGCYQIPGDTTSALLPPNYCDEDIMAQYSASSSTAVVLGTDPGGLTSYGYGRANGAVSGLEIGDAGIYRAVGFHSNNSEEVAQSDPFVVCGDGQVPDCFWQCIDELTESGIPNIPFNCDEAEPGDSADSGSFGGTPTTTSTFVPDCFLDGSCDSGGATTPPADSSDWSSDSSAAGDSSDWSSDSSAGDDSGDWSGDSAPSGGDDSGLTLDSASTTPPTTPSDSGITGADDSGVD
jgi:hypothetical protein